MIRITQLKCTPGHSMKDLEKKICKKLNINQSKLLDVFIRKKSIDSRKKEIFYAYTVDVQVKDEENLLKRCKDPNVSRAKEISYQFPEYGDTPMKERPIVTGTGPAGLFCAYFLAQKDFRPIVIERGEPVEKRAKTVEHFWKSGELNLESNVQFGEGGAGTFSDGKLNTLVKDPTGRNQEVLHIFVEHGAKEEILYVNKPHIGTDVLMDVVKNMRTHIEEMGGTFCFSTKMEEILVEKEQVYGIKTSSRPEGEREIRGQAVVLAPGHSARDTFEMLNRKGIAMEQKPFALGVRVEHPQEWINAGQYGEDYPEELPAADYKLTGKGKNGRGVYSFCMCPGGYVVNASSEAGRLVVNGMSYSKRDGKNANSAIVVTVSPEDFGSGDVLAGVEFQRRLEEKAYKEGQGKIPIQRFWDFKNNEKSVTLGKVQPCMKGQYEFGNLRNVFPEEISKTLIEGIEGFERKIQGFSNEDALLSGIESRTSSPVRILRNENFEASVKGLYPCGEGAGYAGGITSAAMDGIKVAESICRQYYPDYETK